MHSAKSRSDVAPNARRRAQADANLGQALFSRSAERSELLIESAAHSAESSKAQSAESRSDVAPNAQRLAQGDANLGQGLFISISIYLFWDV